MHRTSRKNLFDEFEEQLDVVTPIKKTANTAFLIIVIIIALILIFTALIGSTPNHFLRFGVLLTP